MELKNCPIVDGKVRVKPFYIRCTPEGMFRSDKPLPGYRLHPAFKQARVVHKAVGITFAMSGDRTATWIDQDGDFVSVNFDKQSPWCDITDGGERFFVPRFYFSFSGTPPAIWVSSKRLLGFKLFRAFTHPSTKDGLHLLKEGIPFSFERQAEMRAKGELGFLNLDYMARRAVYILYSIECKDAGILEAIEFGADLELKWLAFSRRRNRR